MDLMFRLVYGTSCRSTHHKFAMDALKRLDDELREPWTRAFLLHHQDYLRGAKDPDDRFRDFTNHVLHVGDNYWGGAISAAEKWYGLALAALKQREWGHAVYSCGVLSHYITDPVMPFHTAQSDRETVIHRACEWSICKSYDAIYQVTLLRLGHGEVPFSDQPDWLAQAVRFGAEAGHRHYNDLIEHYHFERGVKDPPAGLDPHCREILARLFGVSIQLWAGVLSRLIHEAKVSPPIEDMTFPMFFTALDAPMRMVVNKIADAQERELVRAMFEEWQQTGKVVKNLPLDDKMVQEAYQREVVEDESGRWKPLPAQPEFKFSTLPLSSMQPRSATASPAVRSPAPTRSSSASSPKVTSASLAPPVPKPHFTSPVSSPATSRGSSLPERVATAATAAASVVAPASMAASAGVKAQSHKAAVPGLKAAVPEETSNSKHSEVSRAPEPPVKSSTPAVLSSSPTVSRSPSMLATPSVPATPSIPATPSTPAAERPSLFGRPLPTTGSAASSPAAPSRSESLPSSEMPRATISKPTLSTPAPESSPAKRNAESAPANPSSSSASREPKFYLAMDEDVEKAPSIGPKTAKRLAKIGVNTVAELIAADPEEVAEAVDARWITSEMVQDWQDQAKLVCRIPGLRGHDAQLLVGCDYRTAEAIAGARGPELLSEVLAFAGTSQGQSILRSGKEPDRDEVDSWIAAARQARTFKAA